MLPALYRSGMKNIVLIHNGRPAGGLGVSATPCGSASGSLPLPGRCFALSETAGKRCQKRVSRQYLSVQKVNEEPQ